MKVLFRRISLSVVLMTAAVLFADDAEALQRRLGDAAFYAGDYPNAISSYKSALELADRENKSDGWAASALNLGVAYLHNGDIAGARRIHDEFRRRYPLRSAGTLPGDLLAAEGKYAEAEKFFQSLLVSNPEMADATRFSLGTLYLKTGRFAAAYDVFTKLSGKDSPWQKAALNERLYSLICLKRYSEALAVIGGIPTAKRNADVELMLYLAEVYSGKISNLEKNFSKFLEKMPPSPHLRLMELLSQASKTARKAGNYDFASRALYQALSFSVDSRTKRELHKMLVETLVAASSPDAVEQARKYAQTYPSAADRMQVITSVANAQKDPAAALKLYSFVVQNQFPMAEKISAAKSAAVLAEKTKNLSELKKIYGFLITNLPLGESVDYQCRYAAFLESAGKKDLALAQLNDAAGRAAASGKPASIQKPMVKLMEFYWRNNNPAAVSKLAVQLETSEIPAYRYSAKMALGQMLDKNGDFEQARIKFSEAAKIVPAGAAEAEFQAALMAKKAYDYATAARKFAGLAVKYPDFAKTPDALFMAADLYSTINDAEKADQAADLLQKKYSTSRAFAALVLRNAAERGNSGDIAGALKELNELETKFSNSPVADEAALLKGIFLAQLKEDAAAVRIFDRLRSSGNKQLAAESSLRLGEILFKKGDFAGAHKEFIRSAAQQPGTLVSDVAYGRAGDCLLAGKMPLPQANISGALKIFQQLAESSKFSQIRLQALFKYAVALEYMGDRIKALEFYEKTVYCALDMIDAGMMPDAQWCVRAIESALRLIAENRVPGALQRGLRLIELSNGLLLPEMNFSEKMRKNFRQQLK